MTAVSRTPEPESRKLTSCTTGELFSQRVPFAPLNKSVDEKKAPSRPRVFDFSYETLARREAMRAEAPPSIPIYDAPDAASQRSQGSFNTQLVSRASSVQTRQTVFSSAAGAGPSFSERQISYPAPRNLVPQIPSTALPQRYYIHGSVSASMASSTPFFAGSLPAGSFSYPIPMYGSMLQQLQLVDVGNSVIIAMIPSIIETAQGSYFAFPIISARTALPTSSPSLAHSSTPASLSSSSEGVASQFLPYEEGSHYEPSFVTQIKSTDKKFQPICVYDKITCMPTHGRVCTTLQEAAVQWEEAIRPLKAVWEKYKQSDPRYKSDDENPHFTTKAQRKLWDLHNTFLLKKTSLCDLSKISPGYLLHSHLKLLKDAYKDQIGVTFYHKEFNKSKHFKAFYGDGIRPWMS